MGGREKQKRREMRQLLLERDDNCCAQCGNHFTLKEGQQSGFGFLEPELWEASNLVLVHTKRCPPASRERIKAGLIVGPAANRFLTSSAPTG